MMTAAGGRIAEGAEGQEGQVGGHEGKGPMGHHQSAALAQHAEQRCVDRGEVEAMHL
jgi:hypothetical protein